MVFVIVQPRESGEYWPEELRCLRCWDDVDPEQPHYFVRDANPEMTDLWAFIGLLHLKCQSQYLADAEAAGLVVLVSSQEYAEIQPDPAEARNGAATADTAEHPVPTPTTAAHVPAPVAPPPVAPPPTAPEGMPPRASRPPPSALPLSLDATAFAQAPTPVRPPPSVAPVGWRRAIVRATGGRVVPRATAKQAEHASLMALARTPLTGSRRVAVISRKGGVGKTTTTLMLGHTFASLRPDRVVALDGNPDAGSLGYRVQRESSSTLTTLLDDRDQLMRYADVRRHTHQAPTGLEVIASDDNARITEAVGEEEMIEAIEILDRYYNLILLDTGTGILDRATQGILRMADQIVLIVVPSLDGARAASLTLDWLERNGYEWLVRGAVAVLNRSSEDRIADVEHVTDHFRRRCRSCVLMPWDAHLADGGVSELDRLAPPTRDAYITIAAQVAAGFGLPARH